MENPIERFANSRQTQRQKALYEKSLSLVESEMPMDAVDVDYTFDNDIVDPFRKPSMTEQQLMTDINWQNASYTVMKAYYGDKGRPGVDYSTIPGAMPDESQPPETTYTPIKPLEQMTDQERRDVASWGLEFMGWFNYNIPRMGEISIQAKNFDSNASYAMYSMIEDYDNKDISWAGTRRFFKGLITDPSTYLGLGTLGVGVIGRAGVKETTKLGMKELLKRNAGKLAATEAGLYSGLDNVLRQKAAIRAGVQQELDLGQLATAVGTGALLGGSLARGAQILSDQIPSNKLLNKVYEGAEQAQADLVSFLRKTADEPLQTGEKTIVTETPPTVVDPGIKDPATAKGKIKRKGYKSPEQLKDIVRAGVKVDMPDEADAVVKSLSDNFEIVDEGWQAYPGGYFDRKVQVTMPDGRNAELQIFSREIGNAKEDMHKIYTQAREIEKNPAKKAEYEQLLQESDKVAASALAAGANVWQGIYDQIGLTIPGM